MDIHTNKRQANQQRRWSAQRKNPAPGRSANESRNIRRTLERLRDHLDHTIQLTGNVELPWLPYHHVVTDRDDEAVIDWRSALETRGDYSINDHGLLLASHDPGIKATNRIAAVTVYRSINPETHNQYYMLRKTLYSPLPCEQWGALPLTLKQWEIIATTLIFSRVLWQWGQAVRDYSGRADFMYEHITGWNLLTARRPFNKNNKHIIYMGERYDGEPLEWTGNIIYKQITAPYSQPTSGDDG